MSHEIATLNGKSAFFGTQPAWHNLGQIVQGARTWQEAMKLAQLDWSVSKHQLISPLDNKPVDVWGIFRDTDNVMLGHVGDVYTTIQNEYAFEFVDTLLETDAQAHYVSAGALGRGERIWCLAQVDGTFDITGTGDKHENYLLFYTSHDGSQAATRKLTTIRVVCNNTLSQALKMGGDYTRVKHTRDAERRLDVAKKLMTGANMGIKELETKLRELSKRVVTRDSFKSVMKKIFGDWEAKSEKGDSVARIESKIADVAKLYESNDKNQFPEIRGTAYNLLNSVTEYVDHESNIRHTDGRESMTDTQIRSENSLFGSGAQLKSNALETILEATKDAQHKGERVVIPQNGSVSNILNMVSL